MSSSPPSSSSSSSPPPPPLPLLLHRWHYSPMWTFASLMDFSSQLCFWPLFSVLILHLLISVVQSYTICFLVVLLVDLPGNYCWILGLLFFYYQLVNDKADKNQVQNNGINLCWCTQNNTVLPYNTYVAGLILTCWNITLKLHTQFSEKEHVFVQNYQNCHWFPSSENFERVNVALIRSPGKLTQTASQQFLILRTSIKWMLNVDLYLFPCKIQTVQSLSHTTKKCHLIKFHGYTVHQQYPAL